MRIMTEEFNFKKEKRKKNIEIFILGRALLLLFSNWYLNFEFHSREISSFRDNEIIPGISFKELWLTQLTINRNVLSILGNKEIKIYI